MRCDLLVAGAIGLLTLATIGCCPVPPGGPSATGVTRLMSMAPGGVDFVDVDVPASTTQLNLEFDFETPGARLRVRQIEPDCAPGPGAGCQSLRDFTIAPPAGIRRMGASGLATPGARTRIVLENVGDAAVTMTLSVVPWRAGCT